MKKRLFSLMIMLITLCCMVFGLGACGDGKSDTPVDDSDSTNQSHHYEKELTLANFDEFISFTSNYSQLTNFEDYHELKGVLTYAYYENVVVTFHVVYVQNGYNYADTTYSGNFVVKLDASGSSSFYGNDTKLLQAIKYSSYEKYKTKSREVTLVGVSGKVIFSL